SLLVFPRILQPASAGLAIAKIRSPPHLPAQRAHDGSRRASATGTRCPPNFSPPGQGGRAPGTCGKRSSPSGKGDIPNYRDPRDGHVQAPWRPRDHHRRRRHRVSEIDFDTNRGSTITKTIRSLESHRDVITSAENRYVVRLRDHRRRLAASGRALRY